MPSHVRRLCVVVLLARATAPACAEPLPSWNDGPTKQALVDFVARVTTEGGPDFVPIPERIATFDNDGTLWCEQPNYVQAVFAIARVRSLADAHPEWKTREPFKSILAEDFKTAFAGGERALVDVVTTTHTGISTDEFHRVVADWLAAARHPRFKRPYTELVYQPMLELLAFLRQARFKTFIVSGGGIEFMRPWTERVYGIPPEQVVGSSVKTRYDYRNGNPLLMRLPEINFIDDGPGKPIGIDQHIGRRPLAAFGNSDGDQQMLQWTVAGPGARLALIVHHTDAAREYAYDRHSPVGRLDKALDQARSDGWLIVDMQRDWRTIFPPEQ